MNGAQWYVASVISMVSERYLNSVCEWYPYSIFSGTSDWYTIEHFFVRVELNFELVQVLCRILAKQLVPGARTSLIQTLLHLQKERFQRLLMILKAHMVSMIRPNEG